MNDGWKPTNKFLPQEQSLISRPPKLPVTLNVTATSPHDQSHQLVAPGL